MRRRVFLPGRRSGFLLTPALIAALIAALVVFGAQALLRGQEAAAARLVVAEPSHAASFPGFGATLTPVSTRQAAQVSAQQAVAVVHEDGMRPDVQASVEPDVTLARFTNTILGQTGTPPFGPPKYDDVLVWDVRYPDAPTQLYGPATGTTMRAPDCDLHVIVDATTAAVIEGFQDCGPEAPIG